MSELGFDDFLSRIDGPDMIYKQAVPVLGEYDRLLKLQEELLEASASLFGVLQRGEDRLQDKVTRLLIDETIQELADVYVTTMAFISGDAYKERIFQEKVRTGTGRLANAIHCVGQGIA